MISRSWRRVPRPGVVPRSLSDAVAPATTFCKAYADFTEEQVGPGWYRALVPQVAMPYFQDVQRALADEGKHGAKVYPPAALVYRCLRLTPLERVRVVIVGQDPYPGAGQADGLAFSVPASVPFPSGLKNIFQELTKDIPNFKVHPTNGSLTPWAMQGVLLLNATLTVRANEPGSHKDLGWSRFTDAILKAVVERDAESPAVFMLWGRHAQAKVAALDLPLRKQPRFLVLTRAHPSGLSAHRGFLGCQHFSRANNFLTSRHADPIHWSLDCQCT